MTDERKQELSLKVITDFLAKNYPEEFEQADSSDKMQALFSEHSDELTTELGKLTDEDFDSLDAQEAEQAREEEKAQAIMAAKGAKLKKLSEMKNKSAKKCKCGCDLVTVKEKGGKITTKCACNCGGGKMKKEDGGEISNKPVYKCGGKVKKSQDGSKLPYAKKSLSAKVDQDLKDQAKGTNAGEGGTPVTDRISKAKLAKTKKPLIKK